MKKINVTVEKTSTGYSAGAEKYPVYTAGDTLEEIQSNMVEALNLHFEEEGKTFTEAEIKLELEIASFRH